MTIKVEREALLRVLERPPSNTPIGSTEDYLLVDYGNLINPNENSVEKLRQTQGDDEDSVCTESTASFSDTDSEDADPEERRVSFAEDLVSEEWSRPYTAREDLPHLFYTTEETQRYVQNSTHSTCEGFSPFAGKSMSGTSELDIVVYILHNGLYPHCFTFCFE